LGYAAGFKLVVDKLALVAIVAFSWSKLVPLFAHFSLVVFVQGGLLSFQFLEAVRVGAFVSKFTLTCLKPVLAQFSFIVNSEVLDIPDHFRSG
jgi:hypothetical protein